MSSSIFDKNINPVLASASNDDLETLVEYLKTKLSEDLTCHDDYKRYYPNHRRYVDVIAKEIRDMGGNSFANLWRGQGPDYHEIVCDVASKLNAPYNKNKSVEDIENSILETILERALSEMSDEQKTELLKEMGGKATMGKGSLATAAFIGIFRSGGFYSYQLTLIIANQIAKAVLGRGLMLVTNASFARVAAVLTGPIGWVISGVWAAVDLAGPAYKVTIPCVIHVAMLRKKISSLTCSKCETILTDTTMKFCPECGQSTAA